MTPLYTKNDDCKQISNASISFGTVRLILPKIHKPNVRFRPIVSFIGAATNQLAKFLKQFFAPLVRNTQYTVKNFSGLVELNSSSANLNYTFRLMWKTCLLRYHLKPSKLLWLIELAMIARWEVEQASQCRN